MFCGGTSDLRLGGQNNILKTYKLRFFSVFLQSTGRIKRQNEQAGQELGRQVFSLICLWDSWEGEKVLSRASEGPRECVTMSCWKGCAM